MHENTYVVWTVYLKCVYCEWYVLRSKFHQMMMRQKTMRRQKATMMLKMWRWKLGTQKKVHAQNVQLGPPILRKKTQALNVQLVGPPILRKARMWHVLACRHQNATAIHMRASVCACVRVCIRLCVLFVCVCARECVRLYVRAKTKKQTMAKAVSFQRRCLKTMEHHATESMKVQPHKPFELAWNVGNADACLQ